MGYVIFYCTDVISVNPLTVGTLFALSKVIDGVTDIIAGYIVDRTNTKWGRGRPFDVCLIGAWISVVMIFMCPAGWPENVKVAWVVGWYILANSVFYTFLNAGEGVFFIRTFNKPQAVKMTSQGSIATSLMGLLCGITVPMMVNNAGKDPASWIVMAIVIAIPMTLTGLCRMLFVKEENDTVEIVEEKVKTDLRDIIRMFGKNKYLVIFSIVSLFSNIVGNMGVGVYYFDKVLGNLSIQSIFSAASALAVVALVILPPLMKRFHLQKILLVGQIASIFFNACCFIFYNNLPVLVVCYVLNTFATLPGVYVGRIIMMDCAIYNEFLGLNRMEGTMSSVVGFTRRAGSALGTFLLGVGLTLIQYDSTATVLAPITLMGLRVMMYGLPVIMAVIQVVLWLMYDLEKRLPEIKEKLAASRSTEVLAAEEPNQ